MIRNHSREARNTSRSTDHSIKIVKYAWRAFGANMLIALIAELVITALMIAQIIDQLLAIILLAVVVLVSLLICAICAIIADTIDSRRTRDIHVNNMTAIATYDAQ